MRILHVKGGRPLGGIATFLLNVVSEIDGIKFDYLLNGEDIYKEFDDAAELKGGNVYIAPQLKNLWKYINYIKGFYKKEGHKYDAVHIHSPNIAFLHLIYAKKSQIKTRILHSHNTVYSDSRLKSIRNFLLQIPIMAFSTHYVACGKKAANFLFGEKEIINTKLIYNGIDIEKFKFNKLSRDSERSRLNIENKMVIGHVGNFVAQKNHDFIIKIAKEMSYLNKDFIIVLVGDGENYNKIKRKIENEKLNDYFLLYGRSNQVEKLLNIFDIFILPSYYEGLPYVVIEAQCNCLPILLSDNIDREVITNENVELLPLNKDLWVKRLTEKKCMRVDEINSRLFEKFDAINQSSELKSFYEKIVKNKA